MITIVKMDLEQTVKIQKEEKIKFPEALNHPNDVINGKVEPIFSTLKLLIKKTKRPFSQSTKQIHICYQNAPRTGCELLSQKPELMTGFMITVTCMHSLIMHNMSNTFL